MKMFLGSVIHKRRLLVKISEPNSTFMSYTRPEWPRRFYQCPSADNLARLLRFRGVCSAAPGPRMLRTVPWWSLDNDKRQPAGRGTPRAGSSESTAQGQ